MEVDRFWPESRAAVVRASKATRSRFISARIVRSSAGSCSGVVSFPKIFHAIDPIPQRKKTAPLVAAVRGGWAVPSGDDVSAGRQMLDAMTMRGVTEITPRMGPSKSQNVPNYLLPPKGISNLRLT